MRIHLPHFNPQQRAVLRNLLGAIVALIVVVGMIALMALLLVFPQRAIGMTAPSSDSTTSVAESSHAAVTPHFLDSLCAVHRHPSAPNLVR